VCVYIYIYICIYIYVYIIYIYGGELTRGRYMQRAFGADAFYMCVWDMYMHAW
jgi:hypothetical protein